MRDIEFVVDAADERTHHVVVVHPNAVIRLGIETLLAGIPVIRSVRSCDSWEEALLVLREQGGGVDTRTVMVAQELCESAEHREDLPPLVKLVVLLESTSVGLDFTAGAAGADGYLVEGELAPWSLCEAFRQIEQGQIPMPRDAMRSLMSQVRKQRQSDVNPAPVLTQREMETLRFIVSGQSNKQIARQLDIGINGVKRHVSSVLAKLNCPNRTQAAAWAVHSGLFSSTVGEAVDPAEGIIGRGEPR